MSNREGRDSTFGSLQKKTQRSFGFQWLCFSEMSTDFKENFLNYVYPAKADFFAGKLGLDAGCGFGRHIYNAALLSARMVGLDFSDAIEASRRNTDMLKNVSLVKGDIFTPPFSENSFDFVYSIGVLHHLPEPERGFRTLLRLVKDGGSIFIWVYSDTRKFTNFIIEVLRVFTTRIPLPILKIICFIFAILDYAVISIAKALSKIVSLKMFLEKVLFERVKIYMRYPFQVIYADWFDRLSAPIRFYYNRSDLERWFKDAGLQNIIISPTGKYGWRAYGEKRN
jgi:SAM-dependent methyltransferase